MSQLNVTTLKHESAGVDNITLASNGFVGIGTSNPQQMLEVSTGSSNNGVRIRRYPTGAYYSDIVHTTAPEGLAFKIGDGSTVTERMRIDSAGRVTMPYQPMACSSWTGYQAGSTIIGSTSPYVITNVGNHLSGGRFTCPVNGVYRATLTGMSINTTSLNARLRFNGASYWGSDTFASYTASITYARVVISALVSCSASDVLDFYVDPGSGQIHPGYGQISFELVG